VQANSVGAVARNRQHAWGLVNRHHLARWTGQAGRADRRFSDAGRNIQHPLSFPDPGQFEKTVC
jgi:hypothetical protein